MLKEKQKETKLFYNFNLEQFVPEDHFLRLVDRYIDFNFIRDKVKHLYSHTGKPAVDPVVLIKILLIGYFTEQGANLHELAEEVQPEPHGEEPGPRREPGLVGSFIELRYPPQPQREHTGHHKEEPTEVPKPPFSPHFIIRYHIAVSVAHFLIL